MKILQGGVVVPNEKTLPRFAPPIVVAANSSVDLRLQFRIRPGEFAKAGEYSEEVYLASL